MSIISIEDHFIRPRGLYNPKIPTLMIVSGEPMDGKTSLSFVLKTIPKSYYVSLDQITVDKNLPIKSINDMVNKKGFKMSLRSINQFVDEVNNNKIDFINYCYNFIYKRNESFYIFDGIYFTNKDFLDEFIKKFENKYYIWITNRPTIKKQ
jgi:hypothetical protein